MIVSSALPWISNDIRKSLLAVLSRSVLHMQFRHARGRRSIGVLESHGSYWPGILDCGPIRRLPPSASPAWDQVVGRRRQIDRNWAAWMLCIIGPEDRYGDACATATIAAATRPSISGACCSPEIISR